MSDAERNGHRAVTRFRLWLGSPAGALVYFGVTWGLVLLWLALAN